MSRERALELLALAATEGLDGDRQGELDRLLAEQPELADGGMERAAAAVHLALADPPLALPPHLRRRLLRAGELTLGPAAARTPIAAWLAAAACLALAVVGWWPRLAPAPSAGEPPVASAPAPESPAEPPADRLIVPWQPTEDPAAVAAGGEVVWSGSRQGGVMRIRGLAANNPAVEQYQLWIFDATRDERYPVDGGVFDVPAGADEIEIPIDAKVAVREPKLFAVTVERPGGVVVSDRERIVLVASV